MNDKIADLLERLANGISEKVPYLWGCLVSYQKSVAVGFFLFSLIPIFFSLYIFLRYKRFLEDYKKRGYDSSPDLDDCAPYLFLMIIPFILGFILALYSATTFFNAEAYVLLHLMGK